MCAFLNVLRFDWLLWTRQVFIFILFTDRRWLQLSDTHSLLLHIPCNEYKDRISVYGTTDEHQGGAVVTATGNQALDVFSLDDCSPIFHFPLQLKSDQVQMFRNDSQLVDMLRTSAIIRT